MCGTCVGFLVVTFFTSLLILFVSSFYLKPLSLYALQGYQPNSDWNLVININSKVEGLFSLCVINKAFILNFCKGFILQKIGL